MLLTFTALELRQSTGHETCKYLDINRPEPIELSLKIGPDGSKVAKQNTYELVMRCFAMKQGLPFCYTLPVSYILACANCCLPGTELLLSSEPVL